MILERRKSVYILPNLLTMGNLFCGFYAIILSLDSNFTLASIIILLAAFLDIFDGKVARLTNTCTEFGVEFDSLADLISFGMAPSILVYLWALKPYSKVGWIAAFLYLICGALRLSLIHI